MMRLHLEGEGSRVRRVASAEAALAFTGGFTPDLITLGWQSHAGPSKRLGQIR